MVRVETLIKITTYLCALSAFAAVVRHIGSVYVAGFCALAAVAALIDFRKPAIVPRWCLNLFSVLALVPSALRIGPDSLVEPVLEGLVLLLGIKLLENKKSRDYLQVFLLCTFLLIGSALVSFSIGFLLFFVPLFFLSTLAMMLLACFAADREILLRPVHAAQLLRQSLLICAISLPLSALLFILLPRTDFPLFTFWNKAGVAKSGFSDSISLGDVAEIQEDSAPAFRAEMDPVREQDLYWRGIELDRFDGASWKRGPAPRKLRDKPGVAGKTISQTIYLEPSSHRYFFALDRPVAIYPERIRRWRQMLVWAEDVNARIRYRAVSVTTPSVSEDPIDRDKYLELPPDFSPRILALVKDLVPEAGSFDAARNLLRFLRSEEFEYSLENLPGPGSPLEEFLLDKKRGNCEYFASALGAMLRAAGVPSRLVAGYRGGDYNDAGGYYLVLQKNAHVWVEAYNGSAWVRFDPTPVGLPPGAGENRGVLRIKLLLDTFNYYWDKFIISYDLSTQWSLWRKVKKEIRNPLPDLREVGRKLGGYSPVLPVLVLLALAIWWLNRRRRRPEEILMAGFARRLGKRGFRRESGEGLEEFVGRISDPHLMQRASQFVSEFQDIFYRDGKFTPAEMKRLKSCIRAL
ncbi:MAG: DUF3488 and transglutaminase-like domain-containing protein [Desulfobacteraceae bacterium]|nr:DUF3488 and transglutaminase-like domain-containing protein [Desulfobacteraceae bacterium]